MREINQKRLGYFEAVYEHRSIRRAAETLNTAPSVITRQIALLEEELGVTLFERRPRGVAPTEVAAHVLEYLRGCQAHRQQLAARLQAVESMEEGSVRIVASEGFMDHLLEKVVGPFCAAHLRLSVELNALSMTDIVRAVAEDEAHIGLAYNPQPDPRISFVASAPAPTKLLVRKNHPLTLIRKPLSLQQILEYPLALMPEGYGVSQVIETLEYAEHIKFNPLLRSNSIVALKRFVRSTDGATFFFAGAAAAPELEAGQVALLDIAHPLCAAAKLRLIVRQSRPLSPAATRMLMEIRRNIPGFGTGSVRSEKSKGNARA